MYPLKYVRDCPFRQEGCSCSLKGNIRIKRCHDKRVRNLLQHAPLSEGHCRKISEALKGRIVSEETCRWISDVHKGQYHSEGHCRKISEALKGRIVSERTRIKHSEAIKRRCRQDPEYRKRLSEGHKGAKSYLWKGGISFEPYCPKFNNRFKERVRAFFGYICQECGTPQNGRKPAVHHVNFRKDSCCDPSAPRLFIPLCHGCHAQTNSSHQYWEQHFTDIINNYYGGKCYFTEEEMVVWERGEWGGR